MRSWNRISLYLTLALAVVFVGSLLVSRTSLTSSDTGWTITSLHSDISIDKESSLKVVEDIRVDFNGLEKHGIFRDIPIRYRYDGKRDRLFDIQVETVTGPVINGYGYPWIWTQRLEDPNLVLQIGDPKRTITGPQEYLITYTVKGAMNAFADHDELFWNVDGAQWPVPKEKVSATVHLPPGSFQKAACFEGPTGSKEPCLQSYARNAVTYATKREIAPGEQMSIVAGLNKGAVLVPPPALGPRYRYFPQDWFEVTPLTAGGALLLVLLGFAFVASAWWVHWRRNRTVLVVEFEPPQNLRPAQLGVILDESADRKDVTATIVHLAVRGYLTIAQDVDESDWIFSRTDKPLDDLQPYEYTIITALFSPPVVIAPGVPANVSELVHITQGIPHPSRTDFGTLLAAPPQVDQVRLSVVAGFSATLMVAEEELYDDALNNGWFSKSPSETRLDWLWLGLLIVAAGGVGTVVLGGNLGMGLIGIAIVLVGILVMAIGPLRPRRTVAGTDLYRHTLGFKLYVQTAERYRQQFAANAGIFTQGLPYAIVFGCVSLWAKAFEGIDTSTSISAWYRGGAAFQAGGFSSAMQSFNSSLSSAISTASSSGGSGFGGGGGSGGGGGGGGGGSW